MTVLALPIALGVFHWTGITLGAILALVLAIAAFVSLLRNPDLSGGSKVGWVVVILLFPIFGSIVYFGVKSDW